MVQNLYNHPDAYEVLFQEKEYEKEVEFVTEHVQNLKDRGKRALIVGCGTGNHSTYLEDAGFEVTGVDPSPAMVERARQKTDGDFRVDSLPDIDLVEEFDLIWIPYTVVNYLSPDELEPSIKRLSPHLLKDGCLVLDIGDFPHMTAPSLQIASSSDGSCARIFWYRYLTKNRLQLQSLTFFNEEWFIDQHELTNYYEEDVVRVLRQSGFETDIYDWYGTMTNMDDPAVFVAHKKP